MKKGIVILISIFITMLGFTQNNQGFKYQSVIRDGDGKIVSNEALVLRVSILSESAFGTLVYSEDHSLESNDFGLVHADIGKGEAKFGNFTTINWALNDHFLQIEVNLNDQGFVEMGTAPLMYVPYALHAETVTNANDADADPQNEIQSLSVSNDTIYLTQGGFVKIPGSNAFSGSFNDLTDLPENLDTDASDDFSGDYNDLENVPELTGDVTGDIASNQVTKIKGRSIADENPGNGQVLKWNEAAAQWEPSNDEIGDDTLDGVVYSAEISGIENKTLILKRTQDLENIQLTFIDEVNDADADAQNEIQVLSISNDTLFLSGGGMVKLPESFSGNYNDLQNKPVAGGDIVGDFTNISVKAIQGKEISANTPGNGQVLKWNEEQEKWIPADDALGEAGSMDGVANAMIFSGENSKTLTLSRSNGLDDLQATFVDEVNDADADPNNELQILSISNDTIFLSNGGAVKLPETFSGDYNDLQNKPSAAGDVTGELQNTVVHRIQGKEVSTNLPSGGQVLKWNSELQQWIPSDDALGEAGTTDGVVESVGIDGSETKTITLIRSNGLATIYATFSDNVNDADADATNEIQNLELSGNHLSISNGNSVDLSELQDGYEANTDAQTLILNETTLEISNGNSVDLSVIQDGYEENTDKQVLFLVEDQLQISNGNSVSLNEYMDNTDQQTLSLNETTLEISNGNSVNLSLLPDEVNDADFDPENELQDISIKNDSILISNGNGAALPGNLTLWQKAGNNVILPQGNLGLGTSNPKGKLEVKGNPTDTPDDLLFGVLNNNGDTVFAVYQGGVRIYVDDTPQKAIGSKGGFAVGGISSSKGAVKNEFLRVTPDSVRIYVNDDAKDGKAVKGGFAVGGISSSKGVTNEFLRITPDSARIYFDDNAGKAVKGGFAVGGISSSKGNANEFLRVTPDSSRIYFKNDDGKAVKGGFAVGGISSSKGETKNLFDVSAKAQAEVISNESRILFYPKKDAFLAGTITVQHPDSVGANSANIGYQNVASGQFSQAFGYQSKAKGDYSMAVGKMAYAGEINSYAFGEDAQAYGEESYAFGRGARADAYRSFAFGSSGIDENGDPTNFAHARGKYSFALGQGCVTGYLYEEWDHYPYGYYEEYYSGKSALSVGVADSAMGTYSVAIGYSNFAGSQSSVAIGSENRVLSDHCGALSGSGHLVNGGPGGVISGGSSNRVSGLYGTIGGGSQNTIDGNMHATIVGGKLNYIDGRRNFIGGGENNSIDSPSNGASVIVGGLDNTNNTDYSFIGGGNSNQITQNYAVLVGGKENENNGLYGVVVGGFDNVSNGSYNFIGGGQKNTIAASFYNSSIIGGNQNTINNNYGFIGNGYLNVNNSHYGFIGGGSRNEANSDYASIVAGSNNTTTGMWSTVVGGYSNTNSAIYGFVGGGQANENASSRGFVGAGWNNINTGSSLSIIVGGQNNKSTSSYGFIGGGQGNISNSSYGTILNGSNNRVSAQIASILSGSHNVASSTYETIIGRYNDTITEDGSVWVGSHPLFIIGNGSSEENRSNAMVVYKNGNATINGDLSVDGTINLVSGSSFTIDGSDVMTPWLKSGNNLYYEPGNVGMGTSNPLSNLHVVGADTLGRIIIAPNELSSEYDSELILAEDNDYTYGMSIKYDGGDNKMYVYGKSNSTIHGPHVSIGRNDGSIAAPGIYGRSVSGGISVYIDADGNLGTVSSSKRYKNKIRAMESIDWLYKLRPVNFAYKNDSTHTKQYGFIAEEVEQANQSFVAYNNKGKIETVKYNQLISPMVKAIQEQKVIIDKQAQELEQIKNELEELKRLIKKVNK